jgi:hypothetical protein
VTNKNNRLKEAGIDSPFAIKNERRKAARTESSKDFRQGRQNRAAFAWGGAFGTDVARVWNDCVLGTSASPREDKRSAQDHEDGADYDG